MTEQTRDPLRAWPIIDGPMQGQDWAHAADYFYAAEVVVPGTGRPRGELGERVRSARTEYRLHKLQSGGYVWSCKSA
jgi:hypothetical protein